MAGKNYLRFVLFRAYVEVSTLRGQLSRTDLTLKLLRKKGKALKLRTTLYGLRQSPRVFWKYMVEKMELSGMPQSKLDPRLFVCEKVIAICYVDDLLFWARDENDIHDLAMKLVSKGSTWSRRTTPQVILASH